jgi:hypothetical protein
MMKIVSLLVIGAVLLLAAVCMVALPLMLLLVIVGSFVFWIWMLVDAIRNDSLSGWARVVWAVGIWFTHWIGALIYFCIARRRRLSEPIAISTVSV